MKVHFLRYSFLAAGLFHFGCLPLTAQLGSLKTKLKPQTVTEFQAYASGVEAQLKARWNGKGAFLELDGDPGKRKEVVGGELLVKAELAHNPRSISDGLIHDWYGAVFIPNTTLARVVGVLKDYDRHSAVYPKVSRSKLIKQDGNDVTGYWRLEEKGQLLPAVFDVTITSHFQEIAPDKWICLSHADDIQSVEDSTTLPVGQGRGFMWKLYSYWALEQVDKGVLAECRSISLSRGIPISLAWIIRPFLNSIPRDSMDSTLVNTRKASGG